MRIILTHEQADFDALASLLGAYLLDEDAVPVVPRRMNRNVRAFITLYGAELPFIDPRDLPAEPVQQVTLVDTQSMITIKGTGIETPVHVVDHHSVREGLPPSWTITSDMVGATATLFVEALQEQNGYLNTLHATLLLLGIYEDTGSLTYSRTTARDLQAAAFLVEHGANLTLAVNFLNHPLSLKQQAIYDELRANIQHHQINGHAILIACGDAKEMEEELSTVAHKLRDLLDPDGLFVLVTTRGGVQLIARSTSDHIDVAEIAAYFGGGGHDRAAAALIHGHELQSVCTQLLEILPSYVQPAVTVAQIMSSDPQLLAPETPVQAVALRMQRYGYEGYPVVKSGPGGHRRILGLLTRRAVDRAISHKLNLPASSLMDAGEVSVSPNDSIEHLQRIMTDSGWGQVPVVHPKSGEIIGIVTRTDLLKTLTSETRLPGRQNYADRLEALLPRGQLTLLNAVARVAHEQHTAIYVVGGFVRDLLLERPSIDFDIVVEGDAIALAKALAAQYGGRVTSHSQFGTAKWHLATSGLQVAGSEGQLSNQANLNRVQTAVDFISARTEFYTHPTALPTVERGSIKLDLHRRDFTINTLALRLDGFHYGELHDYWGGLNDLKHNTVRVLHSISFVDDPTRMVRAVRFEQRFGFKIESRTLQLLHEALPLMARMSPDRIRHELDHVLDEPRAIQMIARLNQLGLLAAIHEDLNWDEWLHTRLDSILCGEGPANEWGLNSHSGRMTLKRELAYLLWLIRLAPERAQSVIERLKLPRTLAEDILAACTLNRIKGTLIGLRPSQIVNQLDEFSPLAVYGNYLVADDPKVRNLLEMYTTRWSKIVPTINGNTLRARGLPPGPVFGRILTTLRRAWLDGEINTIEQETALLGKLIADQKLAG